MVHAINLMSLIELNPYFTTRDGKRLLVFDCPKDRRHRVRILVADVGGMDGADHVWKVVGTDFATLSVFPSINEPGCWHGFVTNGQITSV